jgi:Ala-tRNA(Pro) deacylase
MSIPSRLSAFLEQRGTDYEICAHRHSRSSAETARAAHVLPHQVAKSVILEDDAGVVMAVVPADKQVMLREAAQLLGRKSLRLADEERVASLFTDCERGAIPPVGMAWGLPTLVDDELDENPEVYLECGDHESLLRMPRQGFRELMQDARHGHFCKALSPA